MSQDRRLVKSPPIPGWDWVACLGVCEKSFWSEDKVKFRFCPTCSKRDFRKKGVDGDASLPRGGDIFGRPTPTADAGGKHSRVSRSREYRKKRDTEEADVQKEK